MESYMIDLTKKAEQITFFLEKKGVTNAPTMRVCAALDVSGSMDDEIRDGSLQRAMDQLGGVGVKFDDNGEIDVWTFDTRSYYVGTWVPEDFGNFIKKNQIRSLGGTAYVPFMRDIYEKMFVTKRVKQQVERTETVKKGGFFGIGAKTETRIVYDTIEVDDPNGAINEEPVLVMVITDGEPSGGADPVITLAKSFAKKPIYFTFVGVSNQSNSFGVLEKIERACSNVGFVHLNGFKLSDEEVYEKIITDKLVSFINSL